MRGSSIVWLASVPFAFLTSASVIALQQEIQNIPEESITAALERTLAPKYQQGVFEHGEEAVEAIHNTDPALASHVVNLAKQEQMLKVDLARRQATNVTITTTTDSSVGVVTISSTVTTDSPTSTTGKLAAEVLWQ